MNGADANEVVVGRDLVVWAEQPFVFLASMGGGGHQVGGKPPCTSAFGDIAHLSAWDMQAHYAARGHISLLASVLENGCLMPIWHQSGVRFGASRYVSAS